MRVVVADSSPLNYLTLLGEMDVLHRLYGTIIVPQQVITVLTEAAAPLEVRTWALSLPE
jgi:predicted nucleic acid-binding protein